MIVPGDLVKVKDGWTSLVHIVVERQREQLAERGFVDMLRVSPGTAGQWFYVYELVKLNDEGDG